MNDRELLELAAKAAGYKHTQWAPLLHPKVDWGVCTVDGIWNPLESDGDALRLAVKLNLAIQTLPGRNKPSSEAWHNDKYARELWDGDPYAATRRAIVRAAAEIGRTM